MKSRSRPQKLPRIFMHPFLTGIDPEDRPQDLPPEAGALRLVVSEYRHGGTGDVPVVFFKESGKFQEMVRLL